MTTTTVANDIVNMALAIVGGEAVDDYTDTTDTSLEARLARLFYAPSVAAVFGARNWTFATARDVLDVETEITTDEEFVYSFAYPSNAVKIIAVSEDGTFKDKVEWRVMSSKLIYANEAEIYVEYITSGVSPSLWPDSFIFAVAAHLAMHFAIPLTRNADIAKQTQGLYAYNLSAADETDKQQGSAKETTANVRLITAR